MNILFFIKKTAYLFLVPILFYFSFIDYVSMSVSISASFLLNICLYVIFSIFECMFFWPPASH